MGIRIIIILLIFASPGYSRPISYPGGITVMGFSDNMKDSIYAHYSPSHLYSVGIESKKDKYTKSDYSYLRFTYLASTSFVFRLYDETEIASIPLWSFASAS